MRRYPGYGLLYMALLVSKDWKSYPMAGSAVNLPLGRSSLISIFE
jgi:hypothetical protein